MNLRRALGWFYARLLSLADAGVLRGRYGKAMLGLYDAGDLDAWLVGDLPPSYLRKRESGVGWIGAAGGDVG